MIPGSQLKTASEYIAAFQTKWNVFNHSYKLYIADIDIIISNNALCFFFECRRAEVVVKLHDSRRINPCWLALRAGAKLARQEGLETQ